MGPASMSKLHFYGLFLTHRVFVASLVYQIGNVLATLIIPSMNQVGIVYP